MRLINPGTVIDDFFIDYSMASSKIFWHLTGSPQNQSDHRIATPRDIIKDNPIKSDAEAYKILIQILQSRKLKASAIENIIGRRKTDIFCCVTDLNLKDLLVHREYYGNVAIGFHSNNIYQSFQPVLYCKYDSVLNAALIEEDYVENLTVSDLNELGIDKEIALRSGFKELLDGTIQMEGSKLSLSDCESDLIQYYINFTKPTMFSDNEGISFYQEREWRKVGDFKFSFDDVATIIVPSEFVDQAIIDLASLKIKEVSILTWDLIEKT